MKSAEGVGTPSSPYVRKTGSNAIHSQREVSDATAARAADNPRTVMTRRYYVAAGTSLLAIALFLACVVEGGLPGWALAAAGATLSAVLAVYLVVTGLREELRSSSAAQLAALASIKENEARLAEAQRIAGLGMWTFDFSTRATTWSPETYRIVGLDPSGPVPTIKELWRLIH